MESIPVVARAATLAAALSTDAVDSEREGVLDAGRFGPIRLQLGLELVHALVEPAILLRIREARIDLSST